MIHSHHMAQVLSAFHSHLHVIHVCGGCLSLTRPSPLSTSSSSSCLSPSSSSSSSCSLSSFTRRTWQTCAAPRRTRVRTPRTSSTLRHKTCPYVSSKRLRVYRHHAHMCFQHVRVVPVHTETFRTHIRARFEWTHGVFTVPHNTHHTTQHTAHTPQHKTQHKKTTRPQHHTEIERDIDRQRQKETDREEKTAEERQEKRRQNKTRQNKTRQDKNTKKHKTREETRQEERL